MGNWMGNSETAARSRARPPRRSGVLLEARSTGTPIASSGRASRRGEGEARQVATLAGTSPCDRGVPVDRRSGQTPASRCSCRGRVPARMRVLLRPVSIDVVRPSVLIVDDHRRFRASARALLESEGFEVVGEASDGESALREAAMLRPGLVLLDIQLPGRDGFSVAEQLASDPSAPAVILISSRDVEAYGDRVELAPVLGFVPKNALSGEAIERLLA